MPVYVSLDLSQVPPVVASVIPVAGDDPGLTRPTFVEVTNVTPRPNLGWTYDFATDTFSSARVDNEATIKSRAGQALSNNAAYLALGAPTQAQVVAQVAALTRQVDGLIRVMAYLLDATT